MKGNSAAYLLKLPQGMLARWREVANGRGTSLAQMIREAVNKSIDDEDAGKKRGKKPRHWDTD